MSQETNDKAFINVSTELFKAQNDLELLELLYAISYSMSSNSISSRLERIDYEKVYSDKINKLTPGLAILRKEAEVKEMVDSTKKRVSHLRELVAVYLKGGDIVAAKLRSE